MNFKQGSTFLIISFLLIFYTFSLESCKKEEPLNPFDRENPTDTLKLDSLYNKSIEGTNSLIWNIHKYTLKFISPNIAINNNPY